MSEQSAIEQLLEIERAREVRRKERNVLIVVGLVLVGIALVFVMVQKNADDERQEENDRINEIARDMIEENAR